MTHFRSHPACPLWQTAPAPSGVSARVFLCEDLETRQLLTTYYVNTNSAAASDRNAGTSLSKPLKTITQALVLASNNNSRNQSDTILILAGVYHEQPYVYANDSGASAGNRTVISAYIAPGTSSYEPVFIDAADPTTGTWTQDGDSNIWYLSNFTTETSGVWVDWSPTNDGAGLTQIGGYGSGFYDQRIQVGSGINDMFAGSYYGDIADGRLYVWLADGSNPNSHVIEYANRAREIYQPGTENNSGGYTYASHVDFDGLNLRHDNVYATGGQDLGCAMYTVNDERLIDCNIQWNAGVGVYLRDTSQMIDCVSSNDGSNGIQGQGSGFLVKGGEYDYDYWRNYTDAGEAGIKVITNNPLSYGDIENAEIAFNYGKGIWFDTDFENSVYSDLTGNYIHDNQGTGIDLEASRHFLVANNVITDNQQDGISLNAVEDAGIYNNTIIGNYGNAAVELDGGTRDQGSQYPGTIGFLNNTVQNNIIANNFTVYDLDVPTLAAGGSETNNNTSDYNLFYRRGGPLHFTDGGTYLGWGDTPSALSDWQADSGQDEHSIVADPLFLSGGTGAQAYLLGSNSPAIGLGANLSAQFATDYNGNARPAAGPFDVGAFQYNGGGSGTPGPVIVNTDPSVWVDDQLPDNAAMTEPDESGNVGQYQFWYWESSNVYSGAAALDSGLMAGTHRQYFINANPRPISANDTLFASVWIDPANPPSEIMLEWQDSGGSWDHLAYWGSNSISGGEDGSDDVHYQGTLPTAGVWTELTVPASAVGLAGQSVTGFSFDLYNGRALLDKIGNGAVTTTESLAGTVFQDNNGDGLQDSGEPGLAGRTVFLDLNNNGTLDPGDPTAITDSNGNYSFSGLEAGTYTVVQVVPNDYVVTQPGGYSSTVTITSGSGVVQDFAEFPETFTASSDSDNFIVALSSDGSTTLIWENEPETATPTYSILDSQLQQLTISTGGYQSNVTFDCGNGVPVQSGQLLFVGGETGSASAGTLTILGHSHEPNDFAVFNQAVSINQWDVGVVNPRLINIVGGSDDDDLDIDATAPVNFVGSAGDDTLNVYQGAYTFNIDPWPLTQSLTVNVYDGAAADFTAQTSGSGIGTYHLAGLNLHGGTATLKSADDPADRSVLILSSLEFDGSPQVPQGLLDLGNNDMIVRNCDSGMIESEIASAYDSGYWTGENGITSTAAASDTTYLTALGYMPGTSEPFDGQTVSSSDVLVKYTYYGDTNLDGQVDGTDYSRMDFASLFPSTGWDNGDFNYDGVLDGSDFTLLDNTYNLQGAAITAQIAPVVERNAVRVSTVVSLTPHVSATLGSGEYMLIDPLIVTRASGPCAMRPDMEKLSCSSITITGRRPVSRGKVSQDKIEMPGGGALIHSDNVLGAPPDLGAVGWVPEPA